MANITSDINWFSSMQPHGRHLVWDGGRVTLSQWRQRTGQDAASLASAPPVLDTDAHVLSASVGRGAGRKLGLTRDYAGAPVSGLATPDVGAYQAAAG